MKKNLAAFAVGALAATVTLVSCDRSGADDDDSRTNARGEQSQRMAQRAPDPAPPASTIPPREALADTVITGKIKAAILADPSMQGADVSVNTDKGVVTLAGLVKVPEQTAIASAHAQRQDGVMRVDNHLDMLRQ